jgi:hypothetical protein
MSENSDQFRERLRRSLPPVSESGLARDLWPAVLQRIEHDAGTGVPWWDWLVAAAAALALVLFPELIPALLYHL